MNFNFLISVILLTFLTGCGVKSDPVPPVGTQLPSYVDKFLEAPESEDEKQDKGRR